MAVFIPTILVFIAQWGVDRYFGYGYAMPHSWQNAVAWIIGAVLVWLLGSNLEQVPGKTLIDPATGNNSNPNTPCCGFPS